MLDDDAMLVLLIGCKVEKEMVLEVDVEDGIVV